MPNSIVGNHRDVYFVWAKLCSKGHCVAEKGLHGLLFFS